MFGAHDSGTYEASMPSIEAGTLSLAAASCPPGTCKIVLIELNSGVPPITFRERERLAAVLQKDTSPRCFAFVTTSSATLAAAAVVPTVDKRHIQRSFSNFEDAASWTNELRSGARISMMRLRLRVYGKRVQARDMPSAS